MVWVKRLFLSIILLLVLAAIGIAILLFSFDPNTLKPRLQTEAAKQNLFLSLDGDLGWQLYPHFGINMSNAKLFESEDKTKQAVVSISSVSFSVAVKPLLQQEVEITHIQLDGLSVNYIVYEDGSTNLSALTDGSASDENSSITEPEEPSDQVNDDSSALNFAIKTIGITNTSVRYDDRATATQLALDLNKLALSNVNIAGTPITATLVGSAELKPYPLVSFDSHGQLSFDLAKEQLTLSKLVTNIATNANKLALSVDANIALKTMDIQAEVKASTDNLRGWLNQVDPTIAADIPQSQLKNFALSNKLRIDGSSNITATTVLELDQTTINGESSVMPIAGAAADALPAIRSHWQVDSLNADLYLPPTPEASPEPSPEAVAASEDVPLPIELLKSLDIDASFKMKQLIYSDINVNNINTVFSAKGGLISLDQFKANIEDGEISMKSALDARKAQPSLTASGNLSQLNIGTMAKKLGDVDILSGLLNGEFGAASTGASSQALVKNIKVIASAQSKQVAFSPVNLVKLYCQTVSTLDKKPLPSYNWPEFTKVSPIELRAVYENEVATIKQFSGAIEQFTTEASGSYALSSGEFDFPISLSLDKFADEIQGCGAIDKKWRKQKIPLRCKGSVDTIGVSTCSLDKNYLKQKAKENFEREKEKQIDKAEAELDKQANKLLEKHLDSDDLDKFKNLFK